MTFLPIVERELRVGARRKSTYRIRLITALIGVIVSFFFLFTVYLTSSRSMGTGLFSVLSWYSFCLCLLAGVFITADCLSEEKREGTLGFLFLTDLHSYDMVLGKFFAQSINAFYSLLALMPVLALPLLMGGVTGGEFWRMVLVFGNTLFFSLAVGMLVSAMSRDSQSAMSACFFLILLITGSMALFNGGAQWQFSGANWPFLIFSSPAHPFYFAWDSSYSLHTRSYWYALAGVHLQAWFWLGLTMWVLPRAWQDKAPRSNARTPIFKSVARTEAEQIARVKKRGRLLDVNPVLWLSGENRTWTQALWPVVLLGGLSLFFVGEPGGTSVIILASFVLKVMVAVRACRFFVEARRNGMLELLLSTPLTSEQILAGQWLGLRRVFLWPFVILLIVHLPALNVNISVVGFVGLGAGLLRMAALILDPLAAAWFGMWYALTSKRPAMATGLTVLYILVLPKLAFCVPDFLIDLVIIARVKGKMKEVRALAMKLYSTDATETIARPIAPPPIANPLRR